MQITLSKVTVTKAIPSIAADLYKKRQMVLNTFSDDALPMAAAAKDCLGRPVISYHLQDSKDCILHK